MNIKQYFNSKDYEIAKKVFIFFLIQSIILLIYLIIYTVATYLFGSYETQDLIEIEKFSLAHFNSSIDSVHIGITYIAFMPLLIVFTRVLFPESTRKIGDYFLFYSLLVFLWHALSQLFLGTCILTLIPYQIAVQNGLSHNYELYRWNPLSLPEVLIIPFYLLQIALSIYGIYKMYFILKEN
jgi:hypothetical protein